MAEISNNNDRIIVEAVESTLDMPPSNKAVARVQADARRAEALTLRLAGLSLDAIAERLHVDPSMVHKMIKTALENSSNRNVQELRNLENQRLDRAQAAIWTRVLEGDLRSISTFLKISSERSKLNGMYAPTQIDMAVSVRREMDSALSALEAMVDPLIVDAEIIEDDSADIIAQRKSEGLTSNAGAGAPSAGPPLGSTLEMSPDVMESLPEDRQKLLRDVLEFDAMSRIDHTDEVR